MEGCALFSCSGLKTKDKTPRAPRDATRQPGVELNVIVPLSLPTMLSVPTKTVKAKTGNAVLSLKLELRTPL